MSEPGNTPEITVSELSGAIKRTLELAFDRVRVRGEITEAKTYGSGHTYFCLKDANAKLRAILWRGNAAKAGLAPENGVEVIATGRISAYGDRSEYQLIVERLEYAGAGALLARIEALRARLAEEGLFDAARKRALPMLPEVVGVITSAQGAVLHDIQTTLARRFPRHVLVWPVPVQGAGAAEKIAAAIAAMDGLPLGDVKRPEVLIVARGGGSLEDLMAFNEEVVVRAAAACRIPLISAVGHETDTTLCDFAADLRAPTPSAAAEIAAPERLALLAELQDMLVRSGEGLLGLVARRRDRLELLASRPVLKRPETAIERASQSLDLLADRLERARANRLERIALRLAGLSGKLDALSPLRVLSRGFAAIQTPNGKVVTQASALRSGDPIEILFADGKVAAEVR